MDPIKQKLLSKSKQTTEDRRGKILCFACLSLIIVLIISILYFIINHAKNGFEKGGKGPRSDK